MTESGPVNNSKSLHFGAMLLPAIFFPQGSTSTANMTERLGDDIDMGAGHEMRTAIADLDSFRALVQLFDLSLTFTVPATPTRYIAIMHLGYVKHTIDIDLDSHDASVNISTWFHKWLIKIIIRKLQLHKVTVIHY